MPRVVDLRRDYGHLHGSRSVHDPVVAKEAPLGRERLQEPRRQCGDAERNDHEETDHLHGEKRAARDEILAPRETTDGER